MAKPKVSHAELAKMRKARRIEAARNRVDRKMKARAQYLRDRELEAHQTRVATQLTREDVQALKAGRAHLQST